MKLKFLSLAIVCCLLFNCKKDNKDTFTSEETNIDIPTENADGDIQPDKVVYSGVWSSKTATMQNNVVLNQNNTEVTGMIMYKEFDGNGEEISSTGLLSVMGKVENEVLKVDIYDPKGIKSSTATLTQNGRELMFKLTGNKVNYPETFTATKRSL
ncbi:MAG: hypothetical protein KDD03_05040 [Gelidibacter sp.]|nr:hypothetical protein [Gelidibacter sp.]